MQNCPAELHVYKMTGREGREGVGGRERGSGGKGEREEETKGVKEGKRDNANLLALFFTNQF